MSTQTGTVKITLHKGRTFRTGDFESLRVDAGVELDESKDQADAATIKWESFIDTFLAKQTPPPTPTTTPASKPAATQPTATQTVATTDRYSSLPWKQSAKNPALSTIRVTDNMEPLTAELYKKIQGAAQGAVWLGEFTYKISETNDGAAFLQRWTKQKQ